MAHGARRCARCRWSTDGRAHDAASAHPAPLRRPAARRCPRRRCPKHVAIVMDGNGRWAKERGLSRTKGHEQGEYSLFDTIEGAIELGIPYLSAYAFSTENWKRSPEEVRFLMGFNRDVIRRRRDQLVDLGVRVVWSGRAGRLWKSVISELQTAEEMSKQQQDAHPAVLRQLRRPGRDRRRGRRDRPRRGGRQAQGRQDQREDDREVPLPPRGAGGGPVPAPVRRAAHVQLPALAVGVRGAGLPGHPLARLRPPPPLVRLRALRPARPPLRRERCPTRSPRPVRIRDR